MTMNHEEFKLLLQLLTAIGVILGPAAIVIIKHYADRRTAQKVEEVREVAMVAAQKVEEVKEVLQVATSLTTEKMDHIENTTDKVHTLVNNATSVMLKELAVATRRIAVFTQAPEDIQAANKAESASREHEGKQAEVDAKD